MFLMDFLEAVSKETSGMLKTQQELMKNLLEASKGGSEENLNEFIRENLDKVYYCLRG